MFRYATETYYIKKIERLEAKINAYKERLKELNITEETEED